MEKLLSNFYTKVRCSLSGVLANPILRALFLYQLSFFPLIFLSLSRVDPLRITYEEFSGTKLALLLLSFVLIVGIYAWILNQRVKLSNIKVKQLLWILLPLITLLVISPPLMSRDILAYLIPARNAVVFGQNPYSTSISGFRENSWSGYLEGMWDGASIYGPVFNLLMLGFFVVRSQDIFVYILLYKLFLATVFCGCVSLMSKVSKLRQLDDLVVKLFILNPAILIHFLLDGHNDLLVLTLMLASIYVYFGGVSRLGGYLFHALSVGIKYISVVYTPIFWVRDRKVHLLSMLLSSMITLLVLVALGGHFPGFFRQLLGGSLSFFSNRCIYACTPFINVLGLLCPPSIFGAVKFLLFCGLWAFMTYRYLTHRMSMFSLLFWISVIFNFVYVVWLTPWALTYSIVFALFLSKDTKYLYVSLLLTVYSLLHYFGF